MLLGSAWMKDVPLPSFPPLTRDREVDVVVVGGGIAGLTAAYLLRRQGMEVLLIEARRVGSGESGHTTAHLTELLDTRYHRLESRFGLGGARAAAESSRVALQQVESLALESGDDCGLRRVPAWIYAETEAQRRELEREFAALRRVGADVSWADSLPLPLPTAGALRVEGQAQVHPTRYLRALVRLFVRAGGELHELTRAWDVEDGVPCKVATDRGELRARKVLVLTHAPVSTRVTFHAKVAPHRTYAVAGLLGEPFPDGLYQDMQHPYHHLRAQELQAGRALVLGGEDHRTGTAENTQACISRLEAWAHAHFPGVEIRWRWSGQVLEPVDGLPFIGRSSGTEHVYVATGFSGTGMTFGTLSALLLADAVSGRANPWSGLYEAGRMKPIAQARGVVTENVEFPVRLLRDRFERGEVSSVDEILPGEGRLVRSGGKVLAVSRDAEGRLRARSARCTHLGCHVHWNREERSWDCPCHGSRFDVEGQVLSGPATQPLSEVAPGDQPLEPPGR